MPTYNKTSAIILAVLMLAAGFFTGQWSGRTQAQKTVVATQVPCPGPVLLQDRVTISRKVDKKTGKVTETRTTTPTITVVNPVASPPTSRGQGTHESKLVTQTKYRLGIEYVPSISLTKPAGGHVGIRAGNLPVWLELGYNSQVGSSLGFSYEW